MTEKLIVALDVGTSGCRVMAVDSNGQRVAQKSQTLLPQRRGSMSEYNAQTLGTCAQGVLNELLQEVGVNNVGALALSSQRSTIVLWDKQTGLPVAPVLTWEDGRAGAENAQNTLSQEEVHVLTGLYKTPYFSAPKIAWCLKHCPEAKDALEKGSLAVAPVASYLVWKLTGGNVFTTDPTLAQRTLLFDIHTLQWSEKLCNSFGVPVWCLPKISPSCADYGTYTYDGVKIPIVVCVGDQQAAAAYLPLEKGQTSLNYGTGAFLLHHIGQEAVLLQGMLTSLSASVGNSDKNFLLEGPITSAGSAFLWLQKQGFNFDMAHADALCDEAKHPVTILPALGGLGAPYWDYSLSPVVTGLSPFTTCADWVAGMARAVASLMADIGAYLQANGINLSADVAVSGGLCNLTYLMQFQADLLQRRLVMYTETQATLLGSARLGASFLRGEKVLWHTQQGHIFTPNLSASQASACYEQWQKFVHWCRQSKK